MTPTPPARRRTWIVATAGVATVLALAMLLLREPAPDGEDARPTVPRPVTEPGAGVGDRPEPLTDDRSPVEAHDDATPLQVDPGLDTLADADALVGFTARVVTAEGAPVPDARVTLLPRTRETMSFADSGLATGADDRRSETSARRVWVPDLVGRPTAASDAAGVVQLVLPWPAEAAPGLPPPSVVVLVRHPGHATLVTARAAPAGPRADLGDLVLALDAASITGQLLDEQGRPVAGASVRMTGHEPDAGVLQDAAQRAGHDGQRSAREPPGDHELLVVAAHTTSTDADGRFVLDGLVPGYGEVSFAAPGHQTRTKRVRLTEGRDVDMGPIELQRAATLLARVVGPLGEPIAGATVLAYDGLRDPSLVRAPWSMSVRGPDADVLLLQLRTVIDAPDSERAVTGPDGRARLDRVAFRLQSLFVDAPGFEPLLREDVLPDAGEVILALQRAAVLELRVLDEATGEPLPDARVEATRIAELRIDVRWKAFGAPLEVHRDGARLVVPRAGPLGTRVDVWAESHETLTQVLPGLLPGARSEVVLRLPRAVPFGGVVVRDDGTAVPDAGVAVKCTRGSSHGRRTVTARTDVHGRFDVDGLGPGLARVAVTPPDDTLAPSDEREVVVSADAAPVELTITLRPAATLVANLVDAHGEPVPWRSVRIQRLAPHEQGPPITGSQHADDDGTATFTGLPAGTYEVRTLDASREVDLAEGTTLAVQLTALPDTPLLVAGLVTRGGVPLDGAQVRVERGRRRLAQPITDAQGRFAAGLAEAGLVSLTALPHWRETFTTRGAPSPHLDAVAPASGLVIDVDWAHVTARVVDENGAPARCELELSAPGSDRTITRVETDDTGLAVLGWIEPGRWTLLPAPPEGAPLASGEPIELELSPYADVEELPITLSPGGGIEGTVFAAPGIEESRPHRVYAWPEGHVAGEQARDGPGPFRFSNLAVGAWRVAAVLHQGDPPRRPDEGQRVQVRAGERTRVELLTRAP